MHLPSPEGAGEAETQTGLKAPNARLPRLITPPDASLRNQNQCAFKEVTVSLTPQSLLLLQLLAKCANDTQWRQ